MLTLRYDVAVPEHDYDPAKTYLTAPEAAARLGIRPETLRNVVRDNRIDYVRIVGRLLFTAEAVEAYRARSQPGGSPKTGRPPKA